MVQPVASLPRLADKLVIINLQPTPYDQTANILLQAECGQVLVDLVDALKEV